MKEQFSTLFIAIVTFGWLQISTFNIGNRQYSMHYKSHNLVKKEGLAKLIYFKPKHFQRYSIWEVLSFFSSYLQLFAFCILFILGFFYPSLTLISEIASFLVLAISFFAEFFKILYIDITNHKEEKLMYQRIANSSSNHQYANLPKKHNKILRSLISYSQTTRYKLELLYEERMEKIKKTDEAAVEKLNQEFIQYFKDYKIVSVENSCVIYSKDRRIRYKIEYIFDSKKRNEFPNLTNHLYCPHLVIKGSKEYLGVVFEEASVFEFDQQGIGIIQSLHFPDRYQALVPGIEFAFKEGNKIVGSGKILEKL